MILGLTKAGGAKSGFMYYNLQMLGGLNTIFAPDLQHFLEHLRSLHLPHLRGRVDDQDLGPQVNKAAFHVRPQLTGWRCRLGTILKVGPVTTQGIF